MDQLKITDASGRTWQFHLHGLCRIGRAPENDIVLDDPRVSRYHAFIRPEDGSFVLVDGMYIDGQLRRSANHVLVNGVPCHEHRLADGDQITVGASTLRVELDRSEACANIDYFSPESVEEKLIEHEPLLPALRFARFVALGPESTTTLQADLLNLHARAPKARRRASELDNPAVTDIVDCAVFAPPSVNTQNDESFIVQVFVHLFEQAETVKKLAKEFDEQAERRGCKILETEIARGSKLSLHLSLPGLSVVSPVQVLTWRGRPDAVQFVVNLTPGVTAGNKVGTVTISQNSVPIGQISFTMKLSPSEDNQLSDITGEATIYKKAFISYASQDRNEVLKRVQMLSRLRIDFFQDVLDLEPGARWEKELFKHIDESDLFLLFWSTSAKESKWVMDEVRYAMNRKAGDDSAPPAIVPVIIEGPPPVSPPDELAHLHFNDYLVYLQV